MHIIKTLEHSKISAAALSTQQKLDALYNESFNTGATIGGCAGLFAFGFYGVVPGMVVGGFLGSAVGTVLGIPYYYL